MRLHFVALGLLVSAGASASINGARFEGSLLTAAPVVKVHLVYDAADTGCPARDRLVSTVTARLGSDPFSNEATESIVVQVSKAAGGLTARVLRTGPQGESGRREMSSPTTDCSELFRAVELAVAMSIDPQAGLVRPVAEAPPAPAPIPQLVPRAMSWAPTAGPSDTPVNRMTRGALEAEQRRLDANKPNSGVLAIGLGSGLTVVGGALTIFSATGGQNPFSLPPEVYPALGVGFLIIGVAVVTWGIIQRVTHLDSIHLYGARLDDISARLETLTQAGAIDPGPPVFVPPAPPPER